ncbi:hypothetical protein [Mycoplasma procyoni]|uniref:hypothetical protein n=1 Tax=Mycoplasma procyoni TaxID=568784 RepID=UPI00197B4629|nr:hypothetical protein [Mycoplasma procyoni]MBN3534636.1 hypothetical protein [Mycoplasma procyoni]
MNSKLKSIFSLLASTTLIGIASCNSAKIQQNPNRDKKQEQEITIKNLELNQENTENPFLNIEIENLKELKTNVVTLVFKSFKIEAKILSFQNNIIKSDLSSLEKNKEFELLKIKIDAKEIVVKEGLNNRFILKSKEQKIENDEKENTPKQDKNPNKIKPNETENTENTDKKENPNTDQQTQQQKLSSLESIQNFYNNYNFKNDHNFDFDDTDIFTKDSSYNNLKTYFENSFNTILNPSLNNQDINIKWYDQDIFSGDEYSHIMFKRFKDRYIKIPDVKATFNTKDQKLFFYHNLFREPIKHNELTHKNQTTNLITLSKDISGLADLNELESTLNINFMLGDQYNTESKQYSLFNLRFNLNLKELKENKNQLKSQSKNWKHRNFTLFYKLNSNNILNLELKIEGGNNLVFEEYNNKQNDVFVSKYDTVFDLSLVADHQIDQIKINNNSLSNANFYKKESFKGKHFINKEETEIPWQLKELRKRVFSIDYGTFTMLAKVLPNNPEDQRYYYATNRHVLKELKKNWNKPGTINYNHHFIIPTEHDDKLYNQDPNYFVEIEEKNIPFREFDWVAKNQIQNDGINHYPNELNKKEGMSGADIEISIIDIKDLLEKTKDSKPLVYNYLSNWNNLAPLKLSPKAKFINDNQIIDFYQTSFPGQANDKLGYRGLRYREHTFNYITHIDRKLSPIGIQRALIVARKPEDQSIFDLRSGASGSLLVDENLEMIGLYFLRNTDEFYGVSLLNGSEIDFLGYTSDKNTNSFKAYLQKKIQEHPDKFELINFLNENSKY